MKNNPIYLNPENFFLQSIRKYPSIYPNKTLVAEHLFMVIGNGYEWGEDGNISPRINDCFGERVVSIEDAINAHIEETIKFQNNFDKDLLNRSSLKSVPKLVKMKREQRLNNEIEIIKNSDRLVKESFNYETINYPDICEYSMIVNIPDNITEAWKKIVIEFFDKVMIPLKDKLDEKYFNIAEEKINKIR